MRENSLSVVLRDPPQEPRPRTRRAGMTRRLAAVPESGELPTKGPQSLADALVLITRMRGELDGWRLRYNNLEDRLHQKEGEDPDREDIRAALDYWARRVVEEGWWSQVPMFEPGDARWGAAKARLKKRTVFDLHLAVEGAVLQERRETKREYVDAKSIFRNNENFERAFERAKDPMLERVRSNLLSLPHAISRREVEEQLATCDCSHPRYRHHKQLLHPNFNVAHLDPCDVNGCDCCGWSDLERRADEWLRQRRAA